MSTTQAQPEATRRFTLLDGMGLIAATALTLITRALVRGTMNPEEYASFDRRQLLVMVVTLALIAWTLTLFVLAAVGPRVPGLWRGAGMSTLAVLAGAMAVLALQVALRAATFYLSLPPMTTLWPYFPMFDLVLEQARTGGLVVGGLWIALALAGRWEPMPHWLDRAGRLIGLLWILLALASRPIEIWPDAWLASLLG